MARLNVSVTTTPLRRPTPYRPGYPRVIFIKHLQV